MPEGEEISVTRGSVMAGKERMSMSMTGMRESRIEVMRMARRVRMHLFFTFAHSVSKICTLIKGAGSEV